MNNITPNWSYCITDLYTCTVAGEVTGIIAMPTDWSCYLSINASLALREKKINKIKFLNITGVILRALTFLARSCLGNIMGTMPDDDLAVSKSALKKACRPATSCI